MLSLGFDSQAMKLSNLWNLSMILNKTGIKMCRNKLPFFDNFHFPQDVNFEIQVPKATV